MRGKLVESSDMALSDDVTIQALDVLDFYKYLGMFENEVIKDSKIKSVATSVYEKRVRKICDHGHKHLGDTINSVYSRCSKMDTSRDQNLRCACLIANC